MLAVILPVMAMSWSHHHDISLTDDCDSCTHHITHFHNNQDHSGIKECVLCQFLALSFTTAEAVSLTVPNNLICNEYGLLVFVYTSPAILNNSARAPPAVSLA